MNSPLDLILALLGELVQVKVKGTDRKLIGKLYGFDQHLNMVLGDSTESFTNVSVDNETGEEVVEKKSRSFKESMLYVRGDTVILVAPVTKKWKLKCSLIPEMLAASELKALYRRILRANAKQSSPEFRSLANSYVRDEWRRHSKVTNQKQLNTFIQEWEHYVNFLENANRANLLNSSWNNNPNSLTNNLNEEQLLQLYKLFSTINKD